MTKPKQMTGIINREWSEPSYGGTAFMPGKFEYDGMRVTYCMTTTPAYCGADFIYDFVYNNEIVETYRVSIGEYRYRKTDADVRRAKTRMREWYKRFRYHLQLHKAHARGLPLTYYAYKEDYLVESYSRAHRMDFSFWEIKQQPMYGFGMSQKMSRIRPRVNPNSGNTAAFFAGPYDPDLYAVNHKKWGDGYVTVVHEKCNDYPYDVDGEGGYEGEDNYDEEEW
jgi:hypothetical protein